MFYVLKGLGGLGEAVTTRRRLCHSLANQWHIESIRLTSRIYGDVQREMARRKDS